EQARLHARAAGDPREEADILYFLGASTYFGPAPVLDEIPKWERFVAESRDSLALEAASLHTLGSLYSLRKRFDEGRAAIGRALELYAQAGMVAHRAGTTYTLGELELNAADPAAAERAVRPGYDTFMEMGERNFLGGGAALL